MRRRWSRRAPTAGSCWWRRGTTIRAAKGSCTCSTPRPVPCCKSFPSPTFSGVGSDAQPDRLVHRPRVHGESQGSVCAAGVQRRSQRQRLALRPFQLRSRPMEDRAHRRAEGRWWQSAADHHGHSDRDRPEQQRRPLPVRRHGQAARSERHRLNASVTNSLYVIRDGTQDCGRRQPPRRRTRRAGPQPRQRNRHRRIHRTRDRPRLVPGRDRSVAEDRHRRFCGRADRRLLVLEAANRRSVRWVRSLRLSTRAISLPVTPCSRTRAASLQAGIDIGERHRWHPAHPERERRRAASATAFTPVRRQGRGLQLRHTAHRRPEQQAPGVVAAAQQRLGRAPFMRLATARRTARRDPLRG